MSKRALAISSEGMLSDSQKRALTLLSLGMLAVTLVPEKKVKKRRRGGADAASAAIDYESVVRERIKHDDDEVLTMIKIFLQCQN